MRSGLPWLSVLTCPTRPHYWEQTIMAIDAAGGAYFHGRKVLFVDGDPDGPIYYRGAVASGWAVRDCRKEIGQRQGSARSMLAVLQAAAADEAPYLLYFEDDLQLARHAVEVMERMPVPGDFWALQFCDLKRIGGPDIINTAQTDHHWGNQAMKLPRWTIERGAKWASTYEHQHPYASDVLLGMIGTTPATPFFGVVAPSIVQHIGAESICNPNRDLSEYGRSAHNFPGVDFDARTLLGGE